MYFQSKRLAYLACITLTSAFLILSSCSSFSLSEEEGVAIARKAYIYAYPIVKNYQSLYNSTIDTKSSEYRGEINQFYGKAENYTPRSKNVNFPNIEAAKSYAWMDLRREPLVLTVPKVDSGRYYSIQLTDLYTHNFAYIGTRNNDNEKCNYLIVGPDWAGEAPEGMEKVIRSQSQFVIAKALTQILGTKDLWWVRHYQRSYQIRSLDVFLKKRKEPDSAYEKFPTIDSLKLSQLEFYNYFVYLMQFCSVDSSEFELMSDFAKIGLEPGKLIDFNSIDERKKMFLQKGLQQGRDEILDNAVKNKSRQSRLYGDREFFKGNYLKRAIGANLGLYGRSMEDYFEYYYENDEDGNELNCAEDNYVLRFTRWGLPPVKAFWTLTMYDKESRGLVRNELDRYQFNSNSLADMRHAADASINVYFKEKNPEGIKERNWLPAPKGPFVVVLRMYRPKNLFLEYKYPIPEIKKSD